jgi:hypothetical protein
LKEFDFVFEILRKIRPEEIDLSTNMKTI